MHPTAPSDGAGLWPVLDLVTDAVLIIDERGLVTEANQAARRLFAASPEPLIGQTAAAILPCRDTHPIEGDALVPLPDGSTLEVSIATRPTTLEQRPATAVVLRSRLSQERLRDQEVRTRAIVQTVLDGIVTIDENGIIETFNPAAERIFGYREADVVGKNVSALMPEPYRSRHDSYMRRYLTTREARIIGIGREVVGQRSDGALFPMDLAVSEMLVGGRRMFTGVVRDLTERKAAEQAKAQFVSVVSHELRTPLTSIRGALGLLESGALKDERKVRQMLELASKNTRRLIAIVNDLLDIEKLRSGAAHLERESLDLCALVRNAVQLDATYDAETGVRVVVSPLPGPARVRGDASRLQQVLSNLVSNAIKFSPPGGVVQLGVTAEDESFRVTVRDQGPGIPEGFRSRVFEPFSQADASDTRRRGGTGLGLAIARAIIEQHGGTMGFETEQGKGTTFCFSLPALDPTPRGAPSQGRVLHVESDVDLCNVMHELLAAEGYVAAHTADSAAAALARDRVDVVVIDPLVEGAADLLARGPARPRHIVVFSSLEPPSALRALVDHTMLKTRHTAHELASYIRAHLAGQRAAP